VLQFLGDRRPRLLEVQLHETINATILKGQTRQFFVRIPAGTLLSHTVAFTSPSPATPDLRVFVAVGAPATAAFCARSSRSLGSGLSMSVQGEEHPSSLYVSVEFKNHGSAFLQHTYTFYISQDMTGSGTHVMPPLQTPAAHATAAIVAAASRSHHNRRQQQQQHWDSLIAAAVPSLLPPPLPMQRPLSASASSDSRFFIDTLAYLPPQQLMHSTSSSPEAAAAAAAAAAAVKLPPSPSSPVKSGGRGGQGGRGGELFKSKEEAQVQLVTCDV
jgi:hypothetical protein